VTTAPTPEASEELYIPAARDAVIAYFGRPAHGGAGLRTHCNTCIAAGHALHGYDGRAEPDKVHGDLLTARSDGRDGDMLPDTEACDVCDVLLSTISAQCQAEHDAQQARWARIARPTVLIEYGIPAFIRCRVY
jgi:hypothetical protein